MRVLGIRGHCGKLLARSSPLLQPAAVGIALWLYVDASVGED